MGEHKETCGDGKAEGGSDAGAGGEEADREDWGLRPEAERGAGKISRHAVRATTKFWSSLKKKVGCASCWLNCILQFPKFCSRFYSFNCRAPYEHLSAANIEIAKLEAEVLLLFLKAHSSGKLLLLSRFGKSSLKPSSLKWMCQTSPSLPSVVMRTRC